jgi:hypothetical protein
MGERISEREAARRLGVVKSSVHYQRVRGNFAYGADGLLDWEEVQSKWQSQRPAAVNPESARREQTARVTSAVVKANFGKVRLAHLERSYMERTEARESLRLEADSLVERLGSIPDAIAENLATQFDIDLDLAEDIIARVMQTALVEVGDVQTETEQMVEKA